MDITERKQAEENFVATEARERYHPGDDQPHCLVNSQMRKLFGYRREELSETCGILVPERSPVSIRSSASFSLTLRPGDGRRRELFARRKDGVNFRSDRLNPIQTRRHPCSAAVVDISPASSQKGALHREDLGISLSRRDGKWHLLPMN